MKIGLLGHGVVGSGVSNIIDGKRTKELADLEVVRILVKDQSEIKNDRMTTNYQEILEDPEIDTVVECMGGIEPAHRFLKEALEHNKNIVTSNKKMLANTFMDLYTTAKEHNVKMFYEATTGGGIPWIENLFEIRRIDEVFSFKGIFNGTTNYILSQMERSGSDFDEMLKEAQSLGYAEANPSDDIDGFDVRYKTMLSSLTAFDALLDPEDIPTITLRNIRAVDITWANKNHLSIKYIGQAKKDSSVSAYVIPTAVPSSNYLAHIPSNLNGIVSDSTTLGEAAFIGQGAGSMPTAHAVVQDIIRINEGNDIAVNPVETKVDNSDVVGTFYVRSVNVDAFKSMNHSVINENTLLLRNVKLNDVIAAYNACGDENAFLMEVAQ